MPLNKQHYVDELKKLRALFDTKIDYFNHFYDAANEDVQNTFSEHFDALQEMFCDRWEKYREKVEEIFPGKMDSYQLSDEYAPNPTHEIKGAITELLCDHHLTCCEALSNIDSCTEALAATFPPIPETALDVEINDVFLQHKKQCAQLLCEHDAFKIKLQILSAARCGIDADLYTDQLKKARDAIVQFQSLCDCLPLNPTEEQLIQVNKRLERCRLGIAELGVHVVALMKEHAEKIVPTVVDEDLMLLESGSLKQYFEAVLVNFNDQFNALVSRSEKAGVADLIRESEPAQIVCAAKLVLENLMPVFLLPAMPPILIEGIRKTIQKQKNELEFALFELQSLVAREVADAQQAMSSQTYLPLQISRVLSADVLHSSDDEQDPDSSDHVKKPLLSANPNTFCCRLGASVPRPASPIPRIGFMRRTTTVQNELSELADNTPAA